MTDVHRRTTRLNHIVFVLLGLILLAAGAFLLGRHYGWFDALPTSDRLYSSPEARWLHKNKWVFPIAAVVLAIIGLLALRWLLVQPRIDRLRRLRLDADLEQPGRTAMASDVLTDVIEDDVAEYPGVARARVLLIGAADAPEIIVRVAASPGAELADIHERITTEALPAARVALDADDVPAQVHLVIAGRKRPTQVIVE